MRYRISKSQIKMLLDGKPLSMGNGRKPILPRGTEVFERLAEIMSNPTGADNRSFFYGWRDNICGGERMTNKEAIEYINWMRDKFITDKPLEALDMAISALEKQERETREKPFPFVVGQPAEMFIDGKWEKGKIVAGYRFNDGIVTIETEDGRRFWCGQDRTDIYRPYQEEES